MVTEASLLCYGLCRICLHGSILILLHRQLSARQVSQLELNHLATSLHPSVRPLGGAGLPAGEGLVVVTC